MSTFHVVCEFKFVCSKKWSDLQEINGQTSVRFCDECSKPVFLCNNYEELKAHVQKANCIAIQQPNTEMRLGSVWRTQRLA